MEKINYRGSIPNSSLLSKLPDPEDGDVIKCEDTGKYYTYLKGIWNERNSKIDMSLYQINQAILSQFKPLSDEELLKKNSLFEDFFNKHCNSHYMLLCKDCGYYTVFESEIGKIFPTFSNAVLDIISSLGQILSIEKTEDENAVEIWIIDGKEESLPKVYYLFPYDAGVVYYG